MTLIVDAPPRSGPSRAQLDALTMTLHPHQREALAWLKPRTRALVADQVGLGKMLTGITWAAGLLARERRPGALVVWVTEAQLLAQTVTELARFTPWLDVATSADPYLKQPCPSARAQARWQQAHPDGPDLLVVTYEWCRSRLDYLLRLDPAAVVCDEAAAVRGGGAEYAAVKALCEHSRWTLGLSATLVETSPMEAWLVLDALGVPGLPSRDTFETDYVEWEPGYRDTYGRWVERKALGWAFGAADHFRDYLASVMLRRTAEDVGLSVPAPGRVVTRWAKLTPGQARDYTRADGIGGLRGHRIREKAGRIGSDGSSCLVNEATRELNRRPTEEKTVIYAETLELLGLMASRLETAGISYVSVEGATPAAERAQALARFTEDASVRVFLGSRVLERGLNCQVARVLISLDASWNPGREEQRVGRVRRIGSPHATYDSVTISPDTAVARRKRASLAARSAAAAAVGLG